MGSRPGEFRVTAPGASEAISQFNSLRGAVTAFNNSASQLSSSIQREFAGVQRAIASASDPNALRRLDGAVTSLRQKTSAELGVVRQEYERVSRSVNENVARISNSIKVLEAEQKRGALSPVQQQILRSLQAQRLEYQKVGSAAQLSARNQVDALRGVDRVLQQNQLQLRDQRRALAQSADAAFAKKNAVFQLTGVISSSIPGMSRLTGVVNSIGAAITGALGPIGIFIALIGAMAFVTIGATKALTGLTLEAARATESAQTFSNVFSAVQIPAGQLDTAFGDLEGSAAEAFATPTQFIQEFQAQTRGTISVVDLLRQSLDALQGTPIELREIIAPELGTILDSARRIARARGLNEEFVSEKFLSGLRLRENRRLDDIGVKVDQVKAQEKFAEAVNKSVGALSEEERQLAFVQEALVQLKITADELAAPNSGLDAIARIGALFEDTKLRVGLTLQPLLDLFGDFAAKQIIPVFKGIADALIPAISALVSEFKGLADVFIEDEESLAFFRDGTIAFFKIVAVGIGVLAGFLSILRELKEEVNSNADSIRRIGSEVSGIINRFFPLFGEVIKLVIGFFDFVKLVATANLNQLGFLMGYAGAVIVGTFAKGMLSAGNLVADAAIEIARIVALFLQGFSPPKAGPLSKIDIGGYNVAKAWVDGFLGGILELESRSSVLSGVNKRLGDIFFFDREQVERRIAQLDEALRPFEEQLKIIRADVEAINGFIEPALKVLESVRSRALRELKRGEGDLGAIRALDEQILRLSRSKELGEEIIGIGETQLALARSQQIQERTLLEIQLARLGQAEKEGKSAKEKKGKQGSGDEEQGEEVPAGGTGIPPLTDIFGDLFGDKEAGEGLLAGLEDGIAAGLSASGADAEFDALGDKFQTLQDIINGEDEGKSKFEEKFDSIKESASLFVEDITATFNSVFDTNDPTSVLGGILANLGTFGDSIKASLDTVGSYFSLEGDESALLKVRDALLSVFGFDAEAGNTIGTIARDFSLLGLLLTAPFLALKKFLTGEDADGESFDLDATLTDALTVPVETAIGAVGGTIESAIISIFDALNQLIQRLPDFLEERLYDVLGGSIPVPEAGFITGRAKGGLGVQGLTLVGENGPELLSIRQPTDVFPANATRAIIAMSQNIARRPHLMYAPVGATNTRNSNFTYAPNFAGGDTPRNRVKSRQQYTRMRR